MEKSFEVIIIDDEPPARDILKIFIAKVPFLRTVAVCSNAIQAIDAIEDLKPDLIFLDISMPEMSGMELLSLNLKTRPEVILTTAYTDYAVKSYDFDVIDYLVKPIPFDRFYKAALKFRDKRRVAEETSLTVHPVLQDALPGQSLPIPPGEPILSAEDGFVWLREEKRLLQIPLKEVVYIEGLKDYVKVFLNDRMIVTHMNIGKAEKIFIEPLFLRIHRSHIVRRAAIRVIDGNSVVLTTGKELLIGPNYREELKKHIGDLR